jgi:uncharacterized repeat protein (TIGR03806 family)
MRTTRARLLLLSCVLALSSEALASGLDQRPANASCVAPARPRSSAYRVAFAPFFPGAFLQVPLAAAQSPIDPAVWYVAERAGEIERVRTSGGGQTRALDIKSRVLSSNGDGGLLGLALHPDFASNGELYVFYTPSGALNRVSRFTSVDGGLTFPSTSEQILLTVRMTTHRGGDIHFGPDGYLYIGLGDGGDQASAQNPVDLPGSFLRIDVDSATPYAIPPDNPFAAGGAGAREAWAWGFRNPFRWFFDLATGDLWAGDVGQAAFEELDLIEPGQNYGWSIREGAHCYPTAPCSTTGLTDPVVEYSHEAGCAIFGGPTYRGSALAGLDGAVFFSDFCAGRVWAAVPDGAGGRDVEELLTAPTLVLGFAQGADGEIAVLRSDGAFKIVPSTAPEPPPFPDLLSETGCVDPSNPMRPAPGLIPYDVNEPLWSDGAGKERWVALPDGARMHMNADGDLVLPVGSVAMKNFWIGETLVETRLFMRHEDGGWAGYSYAWNDAQTEATLLEGSEQRTVQGKPWTYPSREQCMSCHTFAAGYTLGLETVQLNRPLTYPATGRTANQLETFAAIGLLDAPLPAPARELPSLSRDSLDASARGYMHTNCSSCHRLTGSAWTPFLTSSAALSEMRLCNVFPAFGTLGISGGRVLVPGDPARSILSVRPHLVGTGQMPPLARAVVDAYGTQVIDDWIRSWTNTCTGPDEDRDSIPDPADNCPRTANASQTDLDADGIGDVCEATCNDGEDDDGDGKVDYPADPGCRSADAASETAACNDGIDNDGDGRIDSPWDVGCEGPWDADEDASCEDGLDNDGNGRMDFDGGASWHGGTAPLPPEPNCASQPFSDLEPNRLAARCGLGLEAAFLLPLLSLARRATRARRARARDPRP